MKTKNVLPVFLSLLFTIAFLTSNAQDGHWVFKEIIQGNHYGSTNQPDKIDVRLNEGMVEFSIKQANNCTDRFRFTYKFAQDMNVLDIPEDRNNLPTYGYEFEITPLGAPCYDLKVNGYSNPRVWLTHWNAPSGLLGNMKKEKTWGYKYHQHFINNSQIEYYAYDGHAIKGFGKGHGEYNVTGPTKNFVARVVKNTPGMATDFRILFKGQSTMGKEEAFYYDILFLYEFKEGQPSIQEDPCDIKQPDCSCCPGTIPVWNFQTKKGDCICPEGQIWNKMENRCLIKN